MKKLTTNNRGFVSSPALTDFVQVGRRVSDKGGESARFNDAFQQGDSPKKGTGSRNEVLKLAQR